MIWDWQNNSKGKWGKIVNNYFPVSNFQSCNIDLHHMELAENGMLADRMRHVGIICSHGDTVTLHKRTLYSFLFPSSIHSLLLSFEQGQFE